MTRRPEMVAVSDRGVLRPGNEDYVAVDATVGLAVLADGMGGHNAGEVASRMAVERIIADTATALDGTPPLAPPDARSLLARHIERANAEIYRASVASRDHAGMGTTVVAALWHGEYVSVGHVGDSRFYRFRSQNLTQLTRDHTVVQARVDSGALTSAQARVAAGRNILTRALGTEPAVDVDLDTHETTRGDLYLLCSDGLTEMLDDFEIARVMSAGGTDLRPIAEELVRRANANGGVDNISVVLVRPDSAEAAA